MFPSKGLTHFAPSVVGSNSLALSGVCSRIGVGSIWNKRTNVTAHCDGNYKCNFAIIGGGAIGSSIAYHLKQHKQGKHLDITVFERDLNYSRCSTVLSAGSIRQQFTLPENIQLSMHSFKFLQNVQNSLTVSNEDPVDIGFKKGGYLFLVKADKLDVLRTNNALQTENGASLRLLSKDCLKKDFPWINSDDLVAGSLGTDNEGWFDPWSLLMALRKKNISLGVKYVQANIVSFPEICENESGNLSIKKAAIEDPANPSIAPSSFISADHFINASGAWSGQMCRKLGIGAESEGAIRCDSLPESWRRNPLMETPLPVEPRKRFIYIVHCPDGPDDNCPMVIDPTGVHFRREGPPGHYLCAGSPTAEEEPDTGNLDVDYNFFDEKMWPVLAHRIPAFERLKVTHAWAGYYDYNLLDQNGVVGSHPAYDNLTIAAGFSGHGIQMSPAVGKAVAELLLDGKFITIDLSRFGFNRFISGDLIYEENVI